jgi:polyphosphate kinase
VERRRYRTLLAKARAELGRQIEKLHARAGRLVVVVEGRDGAGKTGAIRRFVRELPPALYRVTRLGPPAADAPYLARWRDELARPVSCLVLDRSWYNRAALEPVLGYCTAAQAEALLAELPEFERELVAQQRIVLVKVFLDVSRAEQARRLARRADPTAIDRAALACWDAYTAAYSTMLARTHTVHAPWLRIPADDKRATRLRVIRAAIDALVESHLQGVPHDSSRQLQGVQR